MGRHLQIPSSQAKSRNAAHLRDTCSVPMIAAAFCVMPAACQFDLPQFIQAANSKIEPLGGPHDRWSAPRPLLGRQQEKSFAQPQEQLSVQATEQQQNASAIPEAGDLSPQSFFGPGRIGTSVGDDQKQDDASADENNIYYNASQGSNHTVQYFQPETQSELNDQNDAVGVNSNKFSQRRPDGSSAHSRESVEVDENDDEGEQSSMTSTMSSGFDSEDRKMIVAAIDKARNLSSNETDSEGLTSSTMDSSSMESTTSSLGSDYSFVKNPVKKVNTYLVKVVTHADKSGKKNDTPSKDSKKSSTN